MVVGFASRNPTGIAKMLHDGLGVRCSKAQIAANDSRTAYADVGYIGFQVCQGWEVRAHFG
jgi:hypothetical protein